MFTIFNVYYIYRENIFGQVGVKQIALLCKECSPEGGLASLSSVEISRILTTERGHFGGSVTQKCFLLDDAKIKTLKY